MNKIEQIESLTRKFEENLEYYHDANKHYNEHSCRIEYIDPLLKLLGWDVSNEKALPPQYREVIVENYSTETDRPDYSLTLKGVTKFFVEAKKPAVDISKVFESAFQARKYGWNANHKIVVLTNFEYLIVYDTTYVPEINDNCSVALYRKYHYSEYSSKFNEIEELLSRDNIYNGVFDNFCVNNFICSERHKKQVDDLFLEQINNWRLSLSNYLYSTSEKYRSIGKLNDVVQEFINQIVFLRICEDRNLPLYHKLKDTINGEQVKIKLEELFRLADRRYNSGIFEGENIIFDLNNQIIIDIIISLYYPQSPYMFNIIEPNLLGKIYEAFLTEQLSISDNDTIILKKKKDCVNRAVVTTPTEIVKYMVEKTLSRLCSGKAPKEVEKLKIADIACGSGIFLEEAYNYLIQYCIEWYKINQPDYLIELDSGRKKLPLEDKKRILSSCIFGIDIDIHAVEVAKFSLLIKLIEDESNPSVESCSPILPNIDDNIVYGNSLISSNELAKMNVSNEELIEIAPFDWNLINGGKSFDAIIGNPPYVNTEGMHNLLAQLEFDLYKKSYQTAYKQFDKYFVFVERSIQKVIDGGYVCYIIPNKFFKIGAGQKLRKLISTNQFLVSLDDFGDAQLFADKTIYSSIILMQKQICEQFNYAKVKSSAALWSGEENCSVVLKSTILNEYPWRLTTDFDFLNLLKKLDNVAVSITKYVDIFGGIQTSAETNKTYWFSLENVLQEDENTFTIFKNNKTYTIEKDILRPYFKPVKKSEKGLNTYSILQTDKWIIFPYDVNGHLFAQDIIKTKYSGTYKYLLDNYDDLVPRGIAPQGKRKVPYATADTWYQYGRNQHLSSFANRIKLIVGIMSKAPMYAYDTQNMLISVGGTAGYCAITIKEDSPYELEYIQAWLTNLHTERILQIIGSDFEGGYFARGGDVLKMLPFVELDFNIPEQKEIYDIVVKETREIYKINEQLIKKPEKSVVTTLERKKIKLIKSIEININKVYRLEFLKDD
ncbi:Eco57I restriction-modification methylase domain-containing protein [Sedimentibacter sp. zth1]|uniref:Eco57I restriction-modification methylase domain-containing protein n=1 Tax=Sedimentibacter sp. zth1 TaxID=2816908 RepID=UPI001A93755A|nr:Eco57I restriction-modification methylase domain-containing protein [Sedimentibacter sp. zth1]QSX04791.1 Eco57I restriction-modification methylase domain-containing protein [Sedimentibacter sp. zth1]